MAAHREGVQPLCVIKEEKVCVSRLDQEGQEPPLIKEEPEEEEDLGKMKQPPKFCLTPVQMNTEAVNARWTNDEVCVFLSILAEDSIQHEFDVATRNECVFKKIVDRMALKGVSRTIKQCREKLKKLKHDYRARKDDNSRSGADRRYWRWYSEMDAIYGHRLGSHGRESGMDSASLLLDDEAMLNDDSPSTSDGPDDVPAPCATLAMPALDELPGTSMAASPDLQHIPRKRKRPRSSINRSFMEEWRHQEELHRSQMERHLQLILEDARAAREHEAALRREESAFNQAFLGVLRELVQAVRERQKD